MDTDLMNMVISGSEINEIIKPELREEYHNGGKAEFISMSKYNYRTPGLFKAEFQGTRMIALMSECYYAEDTKLKSKFSCKDISKKQNPISWERYLEALNASINRASNTGFQLDTSGIVTYTQSKLSLSTYYDKQVVSPDGIHTEPLR